MNFTDLNRVLGLVKKAAFSGYVNAGTGFVDSEFPIKLNTFLKDTETRIIGGTLMPEMSVIRAYEFGFKSYLEKPIL